MENKNICLSCTDAYLQSAGLMENCYHDDLRMDFTEKTERSGGSFITWLEKKNLYVICAADGFNILNKTRSIS